MVNGNYIVQDVHGESGAYARVGGGGGAGGGSERKMAGKRIRAFRTAAELNLTLPPKRSLQVEMTDHGAARSKGEPNLIRYAMSEEADSDASSRRPSFVRKPKSVSDASNSYVRAGSGNVSPTASLPTIAENATADTFEMRAEYSNLHMKSYSLSGGGAGGGAGGGGGSVGGDGGGDSGRLRQLSSVSGSVRDLFANYSAVPAFRPSSYFSKPAAGTKKFSAKGTHPDSLYRVTLGGDGQRSHSLPARCYRLLRWPAALLVVCVALALFIYYVMPDSAEKELLENNATYWEAGLAAAAVGAGFRHRPAQTSAAPASTAPAFTAPAATPALHDTSGSSLPAATFGAAGSVPPGITAPSTSSIDNKTSEIDFDSTVSEAGKNYDDLLRDENESSSKIINFHPVPVYPDSVTPDVQYGNEKLFPATDRNPKLMQHTGATTPRPQATVASTYHQTRGDFALYVKDDEADKASLQGLPGQPPRENFTSSHSKHFGLSLEEAARLGTVTPVAHGARVSPTLPSVTARNTVLGITHSAHTTEPSEEVACRSTSLAVCRRVLLHDLAAAPLLPQAPYEGMDELIADVERLASFNCNARVLHFVCHLLEPECTSPAAARKPCRTFCEDAVSGCEGYVYPNSTLEALLDCSAYPQFNCVAAREPCLPGEYSCQDETCVSGERRCDGRSDCVGTGVDEQLCPKCNATEFSCTRSGCIPRRWLCDGYADCTDGEDETDCRSGPDGFVPHPASANQYHPSKWLQNWADRLQLNKEPVVGQRVSMDNAELREAAESVLSPQIHLLHNALPHPTKVDRTRVMETSKMHEHVMSKGEPGDSRELLMMSDSGSAARPYQRPPTRRPATTAPTPQVPSDGDLVGEILEDLEKMVDSEKWWETESGRAGKVHSVSPCPAGELRCVDGRCIMFTQLCDGHVDCSDSADEDNCDI